MKKNLKKAISAVIALAVAASLVPATFAAKLTLTDVADTASYATAVNTLVALDVINGYEDGTFLPDNEITRAEVTKVIVAALNQKAAAEGMTGATNFTDVAADFWAAGYVNMGTEIGFINGMGDGTFAPQANVTFAQVVKMLVASLGYEDYAQYMGGWPNGYLSIAASEGITDGVKANANVAVTRAQVAQLVYNAMKTPIVENTGMEYSSAGILVPTIAKQDGKNDKSYKTLLTENFDAYLVEGYVIETSKVASLDADEVKFGIAKSEKYDAEFITDGYKTATKIADIIDAQKIIANVGDTDAADYLNVYASAIVMIDEYDEYTLISFAPSGKNKTVEITSDLLDTDKLEGTTMEIDGKDYDLETDDKDALTVSLYVNGYQVKATDKVTIEDQIKTYVYDNPVGTIELVDTYRTDGYYDAIYVDYYSTYEVEYVDADSAVIELGDGVEISLDEEKNENLVYNIYLDGEKIEISDLIEGDILSIAYDVRDEIAKSDYFDIYVSRATASGKVTGRDAVKEMTVTVGGEVYSFVDSKDISKVALKDELILTLDYFGRIYDVEVEATSIKYAIMDKLVWSTTEEAYKATLYTVDGVVKTYVFDGTQDEAKKIMDNTYASVSGSKETYFTGATRKAVEGRVIEYSVSSSTGKLTSVKFIGAGESTYVDAKDTTDEYEAKYLRIGNIKMSAATKILDVIEYASNAYKTNTDIKVADLDALVDGTEYEAYAFGTKKDGKYPVVIIKAGEGAYNATTRVAVVTGNAMEALDENDDKYIEIPVLYNGEATTLAVAEDKSSEADKVGKGDIVFFQTASNGQVDQIDVIYDFDKADLKANLADLSKLVSYPTKDGKPVAGDGSNLYQNFVTSWADKESDSIKLVLGPVVEKDDSVFSLGSVVDIDENDVDDVHKYVSYKTKSVKNGVSGGVLEIDLADDTNVYVYDPNETKEENQFKKGAVTATSNAKTEDNGDTVIWSDTAYVTYAFAMVVGNEATDVVVFKPAK